MGDKKYDPTMSGYLGDILSGKAKINELRPQHEFFDAIGLEKQLRDNERVIVLLTPKEAGKILFSERLQLRIYLILINIGKETDNGQKKNNGMCFFYTHNVSYVVIYFF